MPFLAAYWIAFGPHGPRSQPPADEQRKILLYTAIGVLTSFVLFTTTRLFARSPPATMTQEYQEESNEFLKVRFFISRLHYSSYDMNMSSTNPPHYRTKEPSLSLVSPPRDTRARARSSRLRRASKRTIAAASMAAITLLMTASTKKRE
jgi:hypothetical protein